MQKSRFLSSLKQLEDLAALARSLLDSSWGDRWKPFPLAKACRPVCHGSVPSPCHSLASLVRLI